MKVDTRGYLCCPVCRDEFEIMIEAQKGPEVLVGEEAHLSGVPEEL